MFYYSNFTIIIKEIICLSHRNGYGRPKIVKKLLTLPYVNGKRCLDQKMTCFGCGSVDECAELYDILERLRTTFYCPVT